MKRVFLCALLVACGGSSSSPDSGSDAAPTTDLTCMGGATGAIPATVSGGADLTGASIAADAHTTVPSGPVTIKCAADIVPAGYKALGPAVAFGPEATWSDRAFVLTIPYKAARLPSGAGKRNVQIVAQQAGGVPYFVPVRNLSLDQTDAYASRATFRGLELTTYQAVVSNEAGAMDTQVFGWNALAGISMGGNASMTIALRHPDRFDAFADLGGEPGPSMIYSLQMVRDYLFGGFCTEADEAAGNGLVGQLCPNASTKPEQFEIGADFEHMITQSGDGVGLTLDRDLYMKASRDLSRALSNPALYNPTNPYAPPGIDFSFFASQPADRCAHPAVLAHFYDREFNPDGAKNVITFCDGGDSAALGLAVFDPSLPQLNPAEILLAVDLNGNGVRDQGEPVITDAYEPFSDVGADGLADVDEPGYDPVTNPDPDHDDYHYYRNPLGTEHNGTYDPGEPFEDVGLDGVMGTCQAPATGCYDYGEGNGHWDLSPNVARWYESDVTTRFTALTDAQRAHVSMWFDAGVRDFLNASVSANAGVADIMSRFAAPFGLYENFAFLTSAPSETAYDFSEITWTDLPKNGYLRYGDPDASAAEIAQGDGKHVGTGAQLIDRAQTAFAWLDKRWPDGDRTDTIDSGRTVQEQTFTSPHTGRVSPYDVFLPPGYDNAANSDVHYPVVYFLHGYGQQPSDLVALSAVFANYMTTDADLSFRFQKFIIVYVDGRCRPNQSGVPVPAGGDGCEGGTFYMDAPLGGPAEMETNLLDLMDVIDGQYRTKSASSAQVQL